MVLSKTGSLAIGARYDGGTLKYMIGGNGLDSASSATNVLKFGQTAAVGSTIFLLAKLDFTGSKSFQVWFNPNLSQLLPTADLSATNFKIGSFGAARIRTWGQGGTPVGAAQFDKIRIGTTYASAIPEPGSIALASLGLTAFIARRRKKMNHTS